MMTNDEIWTMAREYAKHECAMSTLQDKKQLHEDKIIEFIDVVGFLCESHCIVSKEKVNEAYQKALNQIAGGRGYDIPRIESYGTGKRKVLESLFDAETFKNSEV